MDKHRKGLLNKYLNKTYFEEGVSIIEHPLLMNLHLNIG